MKRVLTSMVIVVLLAVGAACSPIEDTKNTLTYVNGVEDYMTEMSTYMEELPVLTKEAVNNKEAKEQLETMVQDLEQQVEVFNELKAPSAMEDVHAKILKQNEKIAQEITSFEQSLAQDVLTPELLLHSELYQSFEEVQSIYEQIQKLGE